MTFEFSPWLHAKPGISPPDPSFIRLQDPIPRLLARILPARWATLCVLALCTLLINCQKVLNLGPDDTKFVGPTISAALVPETMCLFHLHQADSFFLADTDFVNVSVVPPFAPNALFTFGVQKATDPSQANVCTLAFPDITQCVDPQGHQQPAPLFAPPTGPPQFPAFSINILQCPNQMQPCNPFQVPNPAGAADPTHPTIPLNFPISSYHLIDIQDRGFQVSDQMATYQIQPVVDDFTPPPLTGPAVGDLKVTAVRAGMNADFQFPLHPGGTNDGWTSGQVATDAWPANVSTSLEVVQVSLKDDSHNAPIPFCGVSTAENHDCGCNGDSSFAQGPCNSVNVDSNCSNSRGVFLTPIYTVTLPSPTSQPGPVNPNATLTWDPIFTSCHATVPDLSDRNLKLSIHFTLAPRSGLQPQSVPQACPTSP